MAYGLLNATSLLYRTLIVDNRYKLYLTGIKNTLIIASGGILIGVILGALLAMLVFVNQKHHIFKVPAALVKLYVSIFRGTPVLLQILIFSTILVFFKEKIVVAIIVFGLNSSAYVCEIIRGGLLAVEDGQMEAGRSMGLSMPKTLFYIIIPQAFKKALPSLGNEFIALVKETSIVSTIAILDITKAADIITSRVFDALVPLSISALIYFVLVMLLTVGQKYMERRLAASDRS